MPASPDPHDAADVPDVPVVPNAVDAGTRSARRLVLVLGGIALAAVLGTGLFIGGYLLGSSGGADGCSAPSPAFVPLCEAYHKLHDEYVDRLDDSDLVEGAIRGLFQFGVGDPFSGYMSPDEYQRALGDLSGTFSGIGAEMAVENLQAPGDLEACPQLSDVCVLVVVAPLDGSPADQAGLRAGDIIIEVDGARVVGTTIQDQISRVRGPAGTTVTLHIRRDGVERDLEITRGTIVLHEVTSRLIDGHIGYIALHGFSEASADQFHERLDTLLSQGADQVVFDLRDNPGGYISAAQQVASEFIGEGVVFTQESSGGRVKSWGATANGLATDPELPLVVLINHGSASASEIVAAALTEHHRATLIGQSTFGKNTVQVWEELGNRGGVRITISRWFTPDHNSVAPDGVQPDVVVDETDATGPDQDPVLDRALEYLTSLSPAAYGRAA